MDWCVLIQTVYTTAREHSTETHLACHRSFGNKVMYTNQKYIT